MAKERSYLEFKDFPLNSLQAPIQLSSVLGVTKYGAISEEDKRDVIVLKETFVLYDKRNSKLGVFTRSENDHGTKIGQCSTLLSSNFDRGQRDSNPSAQGWRNAPTLGYVPQNVFNAEGVASIPPPHPIQPRTTRTTRK